MLHINEVRRPLDLDQGYKQIGVGNHGHKLCSKVMFAVARRWIFCAGSKSVQRRADEEIEAMLAKFYLFG